MTHGLGLVLVLLAAVPALAQDREVEAGAGMWLLNPLSLTEFDQRLTPSVSAAWTSWYNERSGWTVGAVALPFYDDGETALFGHVTWRRRWVHGEEGNFTHFGFGAGPVVWHFDTSADSSWRSWHFRFLWHVEALTTRRIRDGLALRAGVTFTPLLHIPIIVQPVVTVVWSH